MLLVIYVANLLHTDVLWSQITRVVFLRDTLHALCERQIYAISFVNSRGFR